MTREDEDRFEALAARVTLLEILIASLSRAGREPSEGSHRVEDEVVEMQPGGEFSVDYDPETRTTTLSVRRDDRDIDLEIRTVVGKDQKGREESTIVYGLYGPSLKRAHAGWRGEFANDSVKRSVSNATVEELIIALQWLLGNGAMSPSAVPADDVENP